MEVYDCLKSRLTVRRFKPDPVPDVVVTRIVEAARWAPSSRNQQPWHLVVVRDPEMLAELGRIATSGSFIADAPIAIALAMEDADTPELDSGRALQQMEIMAWSEGLGTCFVGVPFEDQNRKIKELLGIPQRLKLITVLPFGYRPDSIRGTRRRRKPIDRMVHMERFGRPYAAR
jgi:nitroreductase